MGVKNGISSQLAQIINNTIEGILIIEDGFIKSANKSLLTILNYKSEDEIVGNLATGILIPSSTEKYIQYNTKLFQEVSLINSDAEIIPAIIKIKDITIEDKVCKMVCVLDMSELKEKESMLIEQSKLAAMGEMISVIAHQWRQPLNAIASITTRLKMKVKMNKLDLELVEEKSNEINNYLQYMSKTIDDFRNFFEPTKHKELTTLNALVNDSMKIVSRTFEQNNIEVIINNKELSSIYLHKSEISQVILNILNNSRDAILEKEIKDAKVIIDFEDNEKEQILTFCDNAGGIPEDILPKIFQPYFSTKNKKNGTGLGLYICKNIIEKYSSGSLEALNTNEGACFKITLNK